MSAGEGGWLDMYVVGWAVDGLAGNCGGPWPHKALAGIDHDSFDDEGIVLLLLLLLLL